MLDPVDFDERAVAILAARLRAARDWLPSDDPFLTAAFEPGESPEEAARRLTEASRLDDEDVRRQVLETAELPEGDPLISLGQQMITRYREVFPRWQEITAAEDAQNTRLAKALFAAYGTDLPPDATFTLRITDGVMADYPYNGTVAPAKTTFFGLYGRAADFDDEMPFTLPEAFARNRDQVDLSVPLNFVTTNDITGGNSGSPMIDREARVVGVAFDSNIEGLPNEFLFTTEAARTVGVHSAGILEALRSAYGADGIVEEILGAAGG